MASNKHSYKEQRQLQAKKPSYLDPLGVGPTQRETRSQTSANKAPAPSPALAATRVGPKTRESARINHTSNNSTNERLATETVQEMITTDKEAANQLEATAMANEIDMLEEDDILLDQPAKRPEKKTLLALRQAYKRTRCNLARVNSHLEFIYQCTHEEKTPKGLTVNVRCNALLADLTNIKEKFKETKLEAENEFTQSLNRHYKSVKMTLQKELEELERQIQEEEAQATSEELKIHQDMMTKTKENIEKQERRLEERKRKKIEDLLQPKEKKQRESKKYSSSRDNNNTRPRGGPRQARPNFRNKNYQKPTQPQPRQSNAGSDTRRNTTTLQTTTQAPQPMQPAPNYNPNPLGQVPAPHTQTQQLSSIINMLGQLIQQPSTMQQQPPTLLPHPPCSVGQQPPMLPVPQMSTVFGQPPQLSGHGLQGFR